jgi:hypothetical protein
VPDPLPSLTRNPRNLQSSGYDQDLQLGAAGGEECRPRERPRGANWGCRSSLACIVRWRVVFIQRDLNAEHTNG